MTFSAGDILRYGYLWAREAARGEESGRKVRPVCLVVRGATDPAHLYLFALTSRPPEAGRVAIPISEIESKRAGLKYPTWLILDEYNVVREEYVAIDLASTKPLGSFSTAYLRRILLAIKQAAVTHRPQAVLRKE